MKLLSYNSELIYATAQFQQLFSNIRLNRKDKDGSDIIVPCLFSQRSRIFKNLENPSRGKITLPGIYINRTALERASERVNNINKNLVNQVGTTIDFNDYMPVPINITYELTIVTKYPEDMEVILSNFIPFFNQDLYVRTAHPKISGEKIKHQVIWDGSINEEWPDEFDITDQDLQIATTSFKFKTWLFAGNDLISEIQRIQTVDFTLNGVPDESLGFTGGFFPILTDIGFDSFYEDLYNGTITPTHDSFTVSSLSA